MNRDGYIVMAALAALLVSYFLAARGKTPQAKGRIFIVFVGLVIVLGLLVAFGVLKVY